MVSTLRRRFQFFQQQAGYVVGERAKGALALAKAEMWAEATDLEFVVRDDDEVAYCYCDDATCGYHEGSELQWETVVVSLVRPCEAHGTDCPHAEYLSSLGGIMAPSREYLRVVKAELAFEAQR